MKSEPMIHNLCTQGFHIIDGFLHPDLCQSLGETGKDRYKQGLFRGAKIGHNLKLQQNPAIRTDEIFWLDEQEKHPAIHAFLAKMNQLVQTINATLFLALNEIETHFAIYQPGTYYKKHIDQFSSKKTRKISFVYYLNKNWRDEFGGELKLYDKNDELIQTVTPQENRFICFNSELPHEVSLTHQPRYSITGWMKTR